MGNCMSCGGAMKKKMAKGGSIAAGIPYATGAGQTDGKNGMMKKGGMVKKKFGNGGSSMLTNTTPGEKFNPPMKKGGAITKRAKLAALAAPKNKITRADIITGAKKAAKKK